MTDIVTRAHHRAQRRMKHLLIAATYGDPNDRRTRLCSEAEALVRRLLGEPTPEWLLDAQHDAVMAEMDELADAEDQRLPDVPLAAITESEYRALYGDR
jgi:hypothetical protein